MTDTPPPDCRVSPAAEPRPATEDEVREKLRARNLRRGLRLFVLIGVLAAVVVMALTVSRDTLEGLARVRPHWLALTGLLWLLATGVDGLRLSVLSRAGEHRLGIIRSVELILAGYFMAAVTPFQVGGLPLQLYAMNKWGISPGKATAMLLVRGVLFYAMVFAAAPFIASRLGISSVLLKVLGAYVGLVLAGGTVFVLLTLFFPRLVSRWRDRLAAGTARSSADCPRTVSGRVRTMLVRTLGEFGHFAAGLKLYLAGRNIRYLLAASVLTIIYGLAYFGMTAAILGGLGVIGLRDVPRVLGINNLLVTVLLFTPTPGASGIAEAGAAALYALLCPRHMLGVFVVLWRLFSFYIGAFVGGVVALRFAATRRPD